MRSARMRRPGGAGAEQPGRCGRPGARRGRGIAGVTLRDPADAERSGSAGWTRHAVDLLVLAGYLKLVPAEVIARYRGPDHQHPSRAAARVRRPGDVRPPGARGGARERRARERRHGPPGGRGVRPRRRSWARRGCPCSRATTPERLAARVLEVEHRLLPAAVLAAAAAGRPVPIPEPVESHSVIESVMPRALISVSDKRGIVAFAAGTGRSSAGRSSPPAAPRPRSANAGVPVITGGRGHRLRRAARRPGQDAAPGDPRRPARPARPARARRRDRRARDRADRPGGGQPLSLPDDDLAARRARSRTRSRTSTSAARRCSARRRRTTSSCCRWWTRPTTPRCSTCCGRNAVDAGVRREFAAKVFAHTGDYDAAIASYLTPKEEGLPQRLGLGDGAAADAALRREPDPARRALRDRGAARHARPHPAPGQGALLQQPARPRRRDVGGGRLGQPAGVLHHQAHHALRHRRRARRPPRRSARRARPIRCPRSARSSRSTRWWTAPPRRR